MANKIVTATSGKTVNLRTRPDAKAPILEIVAIGTSVEVLSIEDTWTKIKTKANEGYMMNKFLKEPGTISKSDLQRIYDSLKETLKLIDNILK